MQDLTTEQKSVAIQALAPFEVKRRDSMPCWYVHQGVGIVDHKFYRGQYGAGDTPEAAIEDHWRLLTSVREPNRLVVNAFGSNRRAYRWNGFMWTEVGE